MPKNFIVNVTVGNLPNKISNFENESSIYKYNLEYSFDFFLSILTGPIVMKFIVNKNR